MRYIATVFYFLYTLILGILTIPIWLFLFVVSGTVNMKKTYEKTSAFYGKIFSFGYRLCAFMAGARVTATGLEKLPAPDGERFLVVGNHCSNLDPFVMGGWLGQYPLAFISKPSIFKVPFAGRYMWRLRYMAIDRKNNRQGIQVIRQAADTISAARPGARRETLETYTNRLKQLEDITNSFKGVEKSFAIQAGREIRVMVVPEQVNDTEMVLLARDLSKRIEQELEYPGQIKISVIRESRVVDYAK